jgi:hypothetical protein
LATVLFVFSASDYLIGRQWPSYQWCNSDAVKTNNTMAKIPIM